MTAKEAHVKYTSLVARLRCTDSDDYANIDDFLTAYKALEIRVDDAYYIFQTVQEVEHAKAERLKFSEIRRIFKFKGA